MKRQYRFANSFTVETEGHDGNSLGRGAAPSGFYLADLELARLTLCDSLVFTLRAYQVNDIY